MWAVHKARASCIIAGAVVIASYNLSTAVPKEHFLCYIFEPKDKYDNLLLAALPVTDTDTISTLTVLRLNHYHKMRKTKNVTNRAQPLNQYSHES